MAMTILMRSVLAACLVVALATPAHARPTPAATKSGGDVLTTPGPMLTPTIPGAPMPYPNKADISTQGPPVKVMIKTYVDSRDEALKKLTPLLLKPPKDPNTARSQLTAILEGPQGQLVSVDKVIIKRKAGGGPAGSGGFQLLSNTSPSGSMVLDILAWLASDARRRCSSWHALAGQSCPCGIQRAPCLCTAAGTLRPAHCPLPASFGGY